MSYTITREFSRGATSSPGKDDYFEWIEYFTESEKLRVIRVRLQMGEENEITFNPYTEEFRHALDRAINKGKPLNLLGS